jgi:hypothetical protein
MGRGGRATRSRHIHNHGLDSDQKPSNRKMAGPMTSPPLSEGESGAHVREAGRPNHLGVCRKNGKHKEGGAERSVHRGSHSPRGTEGAHEKEHQAPARPAKGAVRKKVVSAKREHPEPVERRKEGNEQCRLRKGYKRKHKGVQAGQEELKDTHPGGKGSPRPILVRSST